MSLVGSLEDLGLGDILQIVSLSRKSGLLLLRSDEGDGRILFQDGLVRAAYVKGEAEDLRGLLAPQGLIDPAALDAALASARESGRRPDEVIAERAGLSCERIQSLRREHVERAVLRMFTWRVGEFSFEVRDHTDRRDEELALATGINAQYLTMEATRLGDEGPSGQAPPDDDAAEDDLVLSGEVGLAAAGAPPAPAEPDAREALALATAARAGADEEPEAGVAPSEAEEPETEASEAGEPETEAGRAAESEAQPDAAAPPSRPAPASPGSARAPAPLVVVDPELRVLEWLKSALGGIFSRVHIFPHVDGGIGRIRQYLGRGTLPTVLVSSQARGDRMDGAGDAANLLARLRGLTARMPVLVLHDASAPLPPGLDAADAVLERPALSALIDRRRQAEVRALAGTLRETLAAWAARAGPPAAGAGPRSGAGDAAQRLEQLGRISERLRDPATRGDVLSLVLDFAAQSFRRVAMFMVRDEEAVGMAQRGLEAAGGPDPAAFRGVQIPVAEPAWFRRVLDSRQPQRSGPTNAGDRQLAALLGGTLPPEAYVGPIESGGRVAALLYADALPDRGPLGDTTALAIVLHEAGLALDRALLERALAEAAGPSAG